VALLVRKALAPEYEALALGARAGQSALVTVGDARWRIVSLHFDAFDDVARAAQAQLLLASTAWHGSEEERALVIAGDFNVDLTHPLSRKGDAATWGALSTALVDFGAGAGATALGGRRVDYVLGGAGVAGRVEVLHGRRVPLGDHDPLLARLTFMHSSTGTAARGR
jgi:endonuclease/exonuclease/phosphatase family metal-dependent hydrolase